ncbi:MAG: DUF2283 domain-containing protein [Nanoarchaeota archaeon]|nr:DUF2283 domain-containing protein [Nanoarchaeota archaeon]
MKEITYDKEADVLNIDLENKKYWKSIELPNGMVVDIAEDGSIISIEILWASKFFSGDAKRVIETAKPVSLD